MRPDLVLSTLLQESMSKEKKNLDNHGCYRPREIDTLMGHLMLVVKLVCCDHQPMYPSSVHGHGDEMLR